jgi:intracellular septation protein A
MTERSAQTQAGRHAPDGAGSTAPGGEIPQAVPAPGAGPAAGGAAPGGPGAAPAVDGVPAGAGAANGDRTAPVGGAVPVGGAGTGGGGAVPVGGAGPEDDAAAPMGDGAASVGGGAALGGDRAASVGGGGAAAGGDGAGGAGGAQKRTPLLVEQLGGWRGLFDSTLPVVVFVVANTLGGLTVAIWSAVAAAALVSLLRLARRQSLQQAMSGLFGVAIAAYIAHRTGTAKGFFLFGIWASFGYAVLFSGSALLRWPLVGVIWEYVEAGGSGWRRHRPLMRTYTLLTLMWAAIFAARGLVQHYLYDADQTGWLAFARIAMGYPVTLGALGVTLLLVRRIRRRLPEPA